VPVDRVARRWCARHGRRLLRFVAAVRAGALLPPELTTMFFIPQVRPDEDVTYGFGLEFTGADRWKDGCWDGASGIVKHYGDHGIDAVGC
jgi:hypothetical protein